MSRPSWDHYFMSMAHLVSTRATCDRKHVGAVAVLHRRILATGYNGSIAGQPHCDDVGHDLVEIDGRESCVRTIHAEVNMVAQAANHGISLRGATIYVNTFPCYNCAKLLIGSGVGHVIFDANYHNDRRCRDAFHTAGVGLMQYLHPVTERAFDV